MLRGCWPWEGVGAESMSPKGMGGAKANGMEFVMRARPGDQGYGTSGNDRGNGILY